LPKAITELKVFLASPSDVSEERARARNVLQLTSDALGETRGIHLKVVGWEDVPPDLGDPQALINRYSEGADLVVVLFARRFGTPTPNFASGTLEEFTRAKDKWQRRGTPRVMLFFKDLDRAAIDDPGPQLKQVLRFRKAFEDDRTGLFNTFSSVEDFAAKFQKHLLSWIDQISLRSTSFPEIATLASAEEKGAWEGEAATELDSLARRIEYALHSAHSVFTPSSPVLDPRFLFGRERYLESIVRERRTRGKCIVLYGPSASGKTSLLKILEKREQAFYRSAVRGYTWTYVVRAILEELGPAEGGFGQPAIDPFQRITTDDAAVRLSSLGKLVIIDAFENVRRAERVHFTELIKKLSDRQAHLTLLLAGEVKKDQTVENLVPNYQEVRRHVTAIAIPSPSADDLERIIDEGLRSLGIDIETDAKKYILASSLGFAHLVHQYCLDCVYALEERIRNGEKQDLCIGMAECEMAESARPTVG
jgi:hypothetical protein